MKGWPSGFYTGPIAGSVRLVIVRELPRTRATLLLRLMGAARTLRHALDDLTAFPIDAPERILALPHLLSLRILAPTEKALPMNARQFLKHTEEIYQQFVHDTEQRGIEQGLTRGRAQGLAPLVRQFTRRLGRPLTDAEQHALTTRLDTLGPDRLGDVVLDFAPDALSVWLADPDAR